MPQFIEGPIGRTVVIADPSVQGSVNLASLDPSFTWEDQRSIITRVTVSHQGNFQFLHTLGNDVYIYVFGDRIGAITISGLSLAADCDAVDDPSHGFERALDWYAANRLASKQGPVRIAIGARTVIEVFCSGFTGDLVDPASRIFQFGISGTLLPKKN